MTAAHLRQLFSSLPSCSLLGRSERLTSPRSARAAAVLEAGAIAVAFALTFACGDTLNDVSDAVGGSGDASFTSVYSDFKQCAECHAPGAQGKTADTEATQDWSSQSKAYASLKGKASGLVGNFSGCNGVSLIGASADVSLLAAALDSDIRAKFSVSADCSGDDISDQTLKLSVSSSAVKNLEDWINAGAPNN